MTYRVLGGEWIDLQLASVDAVLCRWGYMLMVDPAAALRETRRVLRSGGRLALAVWDVGAVKPVARRYRCEVLGEHGLWRDRRQRARRDRLRSSDRELLRSMLEEAGFTEIELDAVEISRDAPDFDSWWATHLDLSEHPHGIRAARRSADRVDRIRASRAPCALHGRRGRVVGAGPYAPRRRRGVTAAGRRDPLACRP